MTNETPDWDPHLQRSRLRGFARLRAILWPRSVRLAEWLALGRHSWYRALRFYHARVFWGVDLHSPHRLQERALIYGATPILTLSKLFEVCEKRRPIRTHRFVELGSGNGLLTLAAACMGYSATGFELESDWVERGARVAQKMGLDCRFWAADFLCAEWPAQAVVFTVATAFGEGMREEMLERFSLLAPGSVLLLGDWSLPSPYMPVWSGPLPVDWGVVEFSIYCIE